MFVGLAPDWAIFKILVDKLWSKDITSVYFATFRTV